MSQYHSKDGGTLFGMEQARGAGNGTSSEERCCKLGGEQLASSMIACVLRPLERWFTRCIKPPIYHGK